jgi:hypothetical protein
VQRRLRGPRSADDDRRRRGGHLIEDFHVLKADFFDNRYLQQNASTVDGPPRRSPEVRLRPVLVIDWDFFRQVRRPGN